MRLIATVCRHGRLICPPSSGQLIGGGGGGGGGSGPVPSQVTLLLKNSHPQVPSVLLPRRSLSSNIRSSFQILPKQQQQQLQLLVKQATSLTATNKLQFRNKHLGTSKQKSIIRNQNIKRRSLRVEITELPEEQYRMEWPKITLFGDSITRRSFDPENGCWASMLAYKVNSFFDVDPRGFEGYNSKWALELVPKLFPKSYLDKVSLFVLFFGHNDSWEMPPLHVPVAQYEANMRAIVKHLLEEGQMSRDKIILITPSWFHLPAFQEYTKSIGMPDVKKELADCEKYAEVVRRLGAEEKLEVVDFFAVTAKYQPVEELFCDGVHFSRIGAKLLYDHLMPVVERKIESAFKKPLGDLWHVVPFDQHPEMVPAMEAFQQKVREAKEAGKLP